MKKNNIRCNPFFQCCGSITFSVGSGSGDPCLRLVNPDSDHGAGSCYFRQWPSGWHKNKIFLTQFVLPITFWSNIYMIFQRKKVKHSLTSINVVFSYDFCMIIEGSGSTARSGSITLTSGSGSGSRRPKKHVDPNPQQCFFVYLNFKEVYIMSRR